MRCANCGTRTPAGESYCDLVCASSVRVTCRAMETLPEHHRITLHALLDDRPVSREDAAGFFGWLTRPLAA